MVNLINSHNPNLRSKLLICCTLPTISLVLPTYFSKALQGWNEVHTRQEKVCASAHV